jgi:hypothetical protein
LRDHITGHIATRLAERLRGQRGRDDHRVHVYHLDHTLDDRLHSEEMVAAFGADNLRLFVPNLDPAIVTRLRVLGERMPPGALVTGVDR